MHMRKNTPRPKRLLSALLTLALVLSLIPATLVHPAQAETPADDMPSSIILKNADYGGHGEQAYQSPNGLGQCWLHRFTMATALP